MKESDVQSIAPTNVVAKEISLPKVEIVPEIDRGKVARDILEIIYAPLKMEARLKNDRISKVVDAGKSFDVTLRSGLINRNRKGQGRVRVVVSVPKKEGSNDVTVTIWWTRDILLYWWTKDVVLKGAVGDKSKYTNSELVRVLADVRHAIDRTVIRKTMDHAYRLRQKTGGIRADTKKIIKKAGL